MVAMQWNVHGAAATMQPVAGLFDDAKDLVAGGELGALVPELEVRAAQGGPRHPHQHFTCPDVGHCHTLDADTVVTMEDRGLHDRIRTW
jgi:hypothetical protein